MVFRLICFAAKNRGYTFLDLDGELGGDSSTTSFAIFSTLNTVPETPCPNNFPCLYF